jgi:hypothetical protein
MEAYQHVLLLQFTFATADTQNRAGENLLVETVSVKRQKLLYFILKSLPFISLMFDGYYYENICGLLYKDTYGICTAVPLLAWWL